ncbi:MAG TPA: glycosyltransferase [Azospirillaceae bacterium]|nr:glycosyltransferase [Azospirillaceae bacterium]
MTEPSTASPPPPPDVAALVVSFEPDGGIVDCLAAIASQVAAVLVLDNGSSPAARAEAAVAAAGAELVAWPDNRGIAAAQNHLIDRALARGHRWVLLLDQDSVAEPGLVAALLAAWEASPDRERVALLAADNREPGQRAETRWAVSGDGRRWRAESFAGRPVIPDLLLAPASGTLIRADALRDAGPLRDGFFIDMVDVEYCVRLRRRGWRLLAVRDARVGHRLGEHRPVTVAGRALAVTGHGASRRYHQVRNAVWTARLHGRAVPALTRWALRVTLATAVKVLLFERGRRPKLAAMLRGLIDGLRRPPG